MTTRRRLLCGVALFASAAAIAMTALPAQADIRVGVVLSTTGPAAAIGIPSKNTVQMWPATIGGQRAQVIILDDASDPSMAVRNVRKLIAEDKVDVIVGPTIVPTALASLDAVAEGQTPMVTLALCRVTGRVTRALRVSRAQQPRDSAITGPDSGQPNRPQIPPRTP